MRPVIEGRMLCQKYVIKLRWIEKYHAGAGDVIGHLLLDISGSRSMDESAKCYNDPHKTYSVNETK
jgi:hypothetical protein